MTTLTTCSNIAEAELLKSLLAASGIQAFLPEGLTANAAPQLVFSSGIRVQVEDEDSAEAQRVIATAQTPPDESAGKN